MLLPTDPDSKLTGQKPSLSGVPVPLVTCWIELAFIFNSFILDVLK